MVQFGYKVYFQSIFSFLIVWVGHGRPIIAFFCESFLYTGVTSANFKTDEKVDEFTDMFTKFNMKGEIKSTFSCKILVGISET